MLIFKQFTQKLILAAVLLFGTALFSYSQELEIVRPLSFGTIVVVNNSSTGTINVDSIGNISFSSNFLFIEPPEYGIVRLSGFPPNAQLTITPIILNSQLTTNPFSPQSFSFDAINTVATVNINRDGTEEIRIGGQISTTNSPTNNYADADFTAGYSITVNF